MIRIETSRQTAVTFKTEKGALNRQARDAEWFASAAAPGEQAVVEVRSRYDAEQGRTLFDVDYVVYDEVAPQDVPEGAQGHVSGARLNHLGKRIPYGYSARVVALHESGRLRLMNYTGTLVQREDEVLTLLPGTPVQPAAAAAPLCAACGEACESNLIGHLPLDAEGQHHAYTCSDACSDRYETVETLRALLEDVEVHAARGIARTLTTEERAALRTAIDVLEG